MSAVSDLILVGAFSPSGSTIAPLVTAGWLGSSGAVAPWILLTNDKPLWVGRHTRHQRKKA